MSDIALEVEDLVKVYQPRRQPAVRAVNRMSFTIPRGVGEPKQIFLEAMAFAFFTLFSFYYAVRCLKHQE